MAGSPAALLPQPDAPTAASCSVPNEKPPTDPLTAPLAARAPTVNVIAQAASPADPTHPSHHFSRSRLLMRHPRLSPMPICRRTLDTAPTATADRPAGNIPVAPRE